MEKLMSPYSKFEPVLLWKHPNPAQGFAAQELTLYGLEDYDFVLIYAGYYADGALVLPNLLDKSATSFFCNGPCIGCRTVGFNGNQLTIGEGKYYAEYGNGNATTNNNFCVPMRIYGIK